MIGTVLSSGVEHLTDTLQDLYQRPTVKPKGADGLVCLLASLDGQMKHRNSSGQRNILDLRKASSLQAGSHLRGRQELIDRLLKV